MFVKLDICQNDFLLLMWPNADMKGLTILKGPTIFPTAFNKPNNPISK